MISETLRPGPPMKIYLSLISLSTLLSSRRLDIADAPAFAIDHGFEGIEILDRHLAGVDEAASDRLGDRCAGLGCGATIDLTHLTAKAFGIAAGAFKQPPDRAALAAPPK